MPLPTLTQARAALTHELEVVNEFGDRLVMDIPSERALTVFVDKREVVTLMTLGAQPEWLVLGFLLNQRLVVSVADVESITVDWEVGAAAVKTHSGVVDLAQKTSKRVVTTGCGQGSMFGDLMETVEMIALPPATITQAQLYNMVNVIRLHDSIYKTAGSVHGCALFQDLETLLFLEDVGRHNAIDAIAGWMSLQSDVRSDNKFFYTTGRLTSEMVIKAAQMGIPVVVSRSGITQMGQMVAQRLGLCTIGRATNKRFLCFSGAHRLVLQPELAGARLRVAA
ncbi:MAG: formate dehydrogenase accessory sulfurtransferase FdhD [Candidatus Saccharibacteria bacterium]|nr:formate dehydrogenase accessory sulfurtransferase FdhD [Rhodoferax sp.]